MLSSIGRASVRRVAARGPRSTNRALQSIRQSSHADNLQNTDKAPTRFQFSFSLHRSYATATKAAVKPEASNARTTEPKTKPTKKENAKAKAVTKKVVKRVVKKPVRKSVKKSVNKPVKKKVVAKKPKKPIKKPVKRVLSEATVARLEARKRRAIVGALKKTALTPPKTKPSTAWKVLTAEAAKADSSGASAVINLTTLSSRYKSLGPAELESYNQVAAQNRAENQALFKKWVESHTPDEIRLANNARHHLRTLAAKLNVRIKKLPQIVDERIPKRGASARSTFIGDRFASGKLEGLSFKDANDRINKEWIELSPAERQVFEERAKLSQQRYVEEYKSCFGRNPRCLLSRQRSAALSS